MTNPLLFGILVSVALIHSMYYIVSSFLIKLLPTILFGLCKSAEKALRLSKSSRSDLKLTKSVFDAIIDVSMPVASFW